MDGWGSAGASTTTSHCGGGKRGLYDPYQRVWGIGEWVRGGRTQPLSASSVGW